jgi:hypothetical protein
MFAPHRKHTYELPRSITLIALLFMYANNVRTSQETHLWAFTVYYVDSFTSLCMYMMIVPHRKHTYWHPRSITGIALFYYVRRCWRMVSSGMLRRVALVRTDVSEEPSASFIRVTRIGELGTALAATSNRRKLRISRFLSPWWRRR